jgi:hypothetical protein
MGMGLGARIVGVIFSPRETFAAVAARPQWLGVLAITLTVLSASYYVLMSNPMMQDNIIDQQISAMERNGQAVSDQTIAGMETFIGTYLPPIYAVVVFVVGPLISAAIAGVVMWIFTALMGGTGTFRQVFAVMCHAGVVSTLSAVFMAGMLLAGVEPQGVRPPSANLGAFVPMLDDTSFVYIFMRTIDLILLWWMFTLAVGLGVLYKRKTGPIVMTVLGIYLTIALIVAFVSSGA